MTDIFLKAKHWQLFLLMFGIPFVFQIVFMVSLATSFSTGTPPDPVMMVSAMKFAPILMIIFALGILGWQWSIATGLQKKVPETVKMKGKKFKVFFFIPLLYILIIMTIFTIAMTELLKTDAEPSPTIFVLGIAAIIPFHLFSMFCIFYGLYFAAKTFKTVELQREVSFSDFAGEFFMIWFYPIGIWIIQPKINRMVANPTGA